MTVEIYMLPWMATSTIATDVPQAIAHRFMILSIFFPSHRLTILGNGLLLHGSDPRDNITWLCLMK